MSTAPTSANAGRRKIWTPLVYFVVVFLCFIRPSLFFHLDEYAGIWRLATAPTLFRFIIEPHNEHFIPLFHTFWALEVYGFRENYMLYVLTNVALLALVAFGWERWLSRIGVDPALAILTPLLALTCLAEAENIMAAWQACILLSSLALIAALAAWCRGSLLQIAVFSCCAALTFSSAYVLPGVLAIFLLYAYIRGRDRRLLGAAAGLLALCALILKLSAWSAAVNSNHLAGALWQGRNILDKVGHLAWLAWYTASIAFYGPLFHLFWDWLPQRPSVPLTLVSLGLVAAVIALSWKSKFRPLVIQLFILQAALFALISPFRHSPEFVGFSGRYYTSGLIPWLSAIAIATADFLTRQRIPARWYKVLLLLPLLLVVRNMRCAWINESWPYMHHGRAARLDYYATKAWLRRHETEPVGNIYFSRSAAPWLDIKMLLPVIGILDPSFVTHPVTLKNVRVEENLVNTRPWGQIVNGRPAVQSFSVDRPQLLTAVEMLVSRNPLLYEDVRLSVEDDAGRILWAAGIPPELWPANAWLALPVDPVRLEPRRTYALRIASPGTNPVTAPTVWINDHPGSFPYGGTSTPDGMTGDFCYRLSFMEP